MSVDHIRYDILTQEALRGVVRTVLTDAAKKRPAGRASFLHHLRHPARRRAHLAAAARAVSGGNDHRPAAPVLGPEGDATTASRSACRSAALPSGCTFRSPRSSSFVDPSVQFRLQFEDIAEEPEQAATPADAKTDRKDSDSEQPKAKPTGTARQKPARTSVPQAPLPAPAAPAEGDDRPPPPDKPAGAEVVRLDRFRKK